MTTQTQAQIEELKRIIQNIELGIEDKDWDTIKSANNDLEVLIEKFPPALDPLAKSMIDLMKGKK